MNWSVKNDSILGWVRHVLPMAHTNLRYIVLCTTRLHVSGSGYAALQVADYGTIPKETGAVWLGQDTMSEPINHIPWGTLGY